MSRLRLTLLAGALLLAAACGTDRTPRETPPVAAASTAEGAASGPAAPTTPVTETAPGPESAREIPVPAGARLGEGYLVWETRRTGRWRIFTQRLDGSGLRALSPDEPGRDHCCPHIAPGGATVVYLSYPRGRDRGEGPVGPLHAIHPDGTGDTVIVPEARVYGDHRAVVWRSDAELIYIDGEGRTSLLDVPSGRSTPLTDRKLGAGGWLIDPTLHFATTGLPAFSPYDAKRRAILPRERLGGCMAYFSGDGRFGYWMAGAGGPVNRYALSSGEVSPLLARDDQRLDRGRSYTVLPHVLARRAPLRLRRLERRPRPRAGRL